MSAFSGIMSSIDGSKAPDHSVSTPSAKSANVKKVKVAPGRQVKDMAAALVANKKSSTTQSAPNTKSQNDDAPVSRTATKASVGAKKRKAIADISDISGTSTHMPVFKQPKKYETVEESVRRQTDRGRSLYMPVATTRPGAHTPSTPAKKTSAPGGHLLAEGFEKRMSLQQMKDDALMILLDRRASLNMALRQVTQVNEPLRKDDGKDQGPLKKSIEAIENQISGLDKDIKKLELFGNGFDAWKINGLDTRVIRALASWGIDVAVLTQPREDEVVSNANLADEEDLFGDEDSPTQLSQATEITEPSLASQAPAPPPIAKPAPRPRPRPTSSVFIKKPKRPATSISQPTRAIQVEHGKATSTAMIDEGLALQAEKASKAAERGQKGKPAFFGAGAGDKPKSRYRMNDDGDVTLRKVTSASVAMCWRRPTSVQRMSRLRRLVVPRPCRARWRSILSLPRFFSLSRLCDPLQAICLLPLAHIKCNTSILRVLESLTQLGK
jgi:hypothetical protein